MGHKKGFSSKKDNAFVSIVVGKFARGSGTVIGINENAMLILTCGHVVRKALEAKFKKATISFSDGYKSDNFEIVSRLEEAYKEVGLLYGSLECEFNAADFYFIQSFAAPVQRQVFCASYPYGLPILIKVEGTISNHSIRCETFGRLIAFDISLAQGSSGASILNKKGEIIGLCIIMRRCEVSFEPGSPGSKDQEELLEGLKGYAEGCVILGLRGLDVAKIISDFCEFEGVKDGTVLGEKIFSLMSKEKRKIEKREKKETKVKSERQTTDEEKAALKKRMQKGIKEIKSKDQVLWNMEKSRIEKTEKKERKVQSERQQETRTDEEMAIIKKKGMQKGIKEEMKSKDQALWLMAEKSQKTAIQLMTPLDCIFALDIKSQLDKFTIKSIADIGHSRIPVYSEFRTNIIGFVSVKSLLTLDCKHGVPLKDITIHTILRVAESFPMKSLLGEFHKGTRMAVVVSNGNASPDFANATKIIEAEKSVKTTNKSNKEWPMSMCPDLLKANQPLLMDDEEEALGIITVADVLEELVL